MKIFIEALTLFAVSSAPLEAALTEEEISATINSVNQRLERGDTAALEEIKKLPEDKAVAAFVFFFKQNYYVFKAPQSQRDIALKAGKMAAENPGAETYFKKLWKKPPEGRSGFLVRQRETSMDLLGEVNTKFSIRLLGEALSEPDLGEQARHLGRALAKMNIPGAPFSKDTMNKAYSAASLEKWKAWWETHKDEYSQTTAE